MERAKRTYRAWPLWGRIAAPAAVAVLLIVAVSTSRDGTDRVDTTTATTISVDDAVRIAVSQLGNTVSPDVVRRVVEAMCDEDVDAAALAAVGSTFDPQATANLIGAAGQAANADCPRVAQDNPTLLNRTQAAAQRLLGTSTSTAVTAPELPLPDAVTTPSPTKLPVAPSPGTTKAPVTTQAPTTTLAPTTTEATTTTVAESTTTEPPAEAEYTPCAEGC